MTPGAVSEFLRRMRSCIGEMGTPAPMEGSADAFSVLVSTVVSLRTKDATTREVSRRLLEEAPSPGAMLSIDKNRLEELLRPAGFFRRKAGQLKGLSLMLQQDFGGRVPDSLENLIRLPGVGRKTANFVLGMVYGVPSICVDVHVHRISNRLGMVRTVSPGETERELEKLFPADEWTGINHTMVRFGQRMCRPARPLCGLCPFTAECPSSTSGGDR